MTGWIPRQSPRWGLKTCQPRAERSAALGRQPHANSALKGRYSRQFTTANDRENAAD